MAIGDRRRKKYKDFVQTVDGEYEYIGGHLVFDPSNPLSYSRYRLTAALACTFSAVMVAAAGLYRAPGSTRGPLVVIPYMFVLIFTFLMCYRGGGLVKAGNPMRRFDYDQTHDPLLRWSAAAALFCLILLVCYVIYVLRHGREGCSMLATVSYPVMTFLAGLADFWLYRTMKKNPWREVQK
jgi:hypothetical protein